MEDPVARRRSQASFCAFVPNSARGSATSELLTAAITASTALTEEMRFDGERITDVVEAGASPLGWDRQPHQAKGGHFCDKRPGIGSRFIDAGGLGLHPVPRELDNPLVKRPLRVGQLENHGRLDCKCIQQIGPGLGRNRPCVNIEGSAISE